LTPAGRSERESWRASARELKGARRERLVEVRAQRVQDRIAMGGMSDEPCARRTIFTAFRRAAVDLWGEAGLQQIGDAMTEEARRRCIDSIVIEEEMLPERFVLEWYEHAWAGPARRDRDAYDRFLDRMMDHGFGRVRKFLLGMATPAIIGR